MFAVRACGWTLVLTLTVSLAASRVPAGDLDKFKAENEIRTQKLVTEVKSALLQAQLLEKQDAEAARAVLRQVKSKIEDADYMPERQRSALEQQVQQRIGQLTSAIRAREEASSKPNPSGKSGQPNKDKGPASVAGDYISSAKQRQEAAKRIQAAKELGIGGALDDVSSASTQTAEQRITNRFVERAGMRVEKLTREEKEILKSLNSTMSVDFDATKFKQALEYIQDKTGLSMIIDQGSMREVNLDYNDPVNFKTSKVTVRTLLRKILNDRGLTYVIKEGSLHVVSHAKSREMMVVRAYPIADLVAPIGQGGPFFNQLALEQNVRILIQTIQGSVDPGIWQANGGGQITFHAPTMSLMVRAPAEVHYMLGFGGLSGRK